MTTWYTADTHLGHRLVAQHRGFTTAAEHDQAITEAWNKRIRPDDMVWLLGDAGMGSEGRILAAIARLNGRKHLITGNHDACWPGHRDARKHQAKWMTVFESVQAFARIRVDGRELLLSHFPYHGDHTAMDRSTQYRLRDEGRWLLHGHTHQADQITGTHSLHVGLDAWHLRPVAEDGVLARIREHEQSGLAA